MPSPTPVPHARRRRSDPRLASPGGHRSVDASRHTTPDGTTTAGSTAGPRAAPRAGRTRDRAMVPTRCPRAAGRPSGAISSGTSD